MSRQAGFLLSLQQSVGNRAVSGVVQRLQSADAEFLGRTRTKKRWTPEQREQSRKFWEKRHAREARRAEAEGRRAEAEAAREAKMLETQRANTTEIVDSDERFLRNYLKEPKDPVTVYRGDGRGMNAESLEGFVFRDVPPKPGVRDVSFFGVVDHQHSNSTPGGMVSNTGDLDIAIGYATDDHNYGIVWEISVDDYIDVNEVLKARNFRNRYPGQKEFLTPGLIPASKIVRVTLYKKPDTVVKFIEQ